MQHNASGSTLLLKIKKISIQFFFNYNLTPLDIQWAIPSLLYQTRRKNPLAYKGLNDNRLLHLDYSSSKPIRGQGAKLAP